MAASVDGRENIQSLKSDWSVLHAELTVQAFAPLYWNDKGRKNNCVFHKYRQTSLKNNNKTGTYPS